MSIRTYLSEWLKAFLLILGVYFSHRTAGKIHNSDEKSSLLTSYFSLIVNFM